MNEILTELPSLGIAGLLFVMWWYERQDRVRNLAGVQEAMRFSQQAADVNGQLVEMIRSNTAALAALHEELRSHRIAETEWLQRLSRQVEQLDERWNE